MRRVSIGALDAIPGLVHGFEQRLGPVGWESRESGRRRLAAALAPARLLFLKQVHGSRLRVAPWDGLPEADAAFSDRPGVLLAIETADCLPVLLVDPEGRRVAAAHAGWRGTVAGVVGEAVLALVGRGSPVERIVAALGPCIGTCCFEVGPELRDDFAPEFFRPGRRERPHLDLRAANVRQLQQAGLRREQIFSLEDCTYCSADLYHSYRREGQGAGRMISYVGWS